MNTHRIIRRSLLFVVCLALALSGRGVPRATAAPNAFYTVSILADSGGGSLRDAITSANGSAGADTIYFSVTGTIALSSALPTLTDANGLTIDGAGNITIDGADTYLVFNTSSSLTVKNLTIQHGNGGGGYTGGAIYSSGSGTLDITNVNFYTNTTGGAVGIYSTGTAYIRNSTFSGNSKPGGQQ